MTKDAFEAGLRQFLQSEPFLPFAIHLTDGRRLMVQRPPVVFATAPPVT